MRNRGNWKVWHGDSTVVIRLISERVTPNGQTQHPATKKIHYPSYLRPRNAKCTNSTSCYKENTLSVLSQSEERQMHKLQVLLHSTETIHYHFQVPLHAALSILSPTEEHQMHKLQVPLHARETIHYQTYVRLRNTKCTNATETIHYQTYFRLRNTKCTDSKFCYKDNTSSILSPTEERQS